MDSFHDVIVHGVAQSFRAQITIKEIIVLLQMEITIVYLIDICVVDRC